MLIVCIKKRKMEGEEDLVTGCSGERGKLCKRQRTDEKMT
jgi:hypothetical protein